MLKTKNKIVAALFTATLAVGCASNDAPENSAKVEDTNQQAEAPAGAVDIVLTEEAFLAKTKNEHTTYNIQDGSVVIVFSEIPKSKASAMWPNMRFRPVSGNYDWSTKKGLVLKLENKGDAEARIEMKVADNIGVMGVAKHQLDLPIYIPVGTSTVEFLFDGSVQGLEGYRGGTELNLEKITEFQLYSVGPIAEQTIAVHSIDYIDYID